MLGPAANILFGPLSFSDLGFGCPDDMRNAWKLPWCCICFYLKSYTFIQNFPPTKIRNSSNKRASIPHKNKRFPACEHRKKLFFFNVFCWNLQSPKQMVSSKRDVYDGIHLYPFTDLDTCTSWQVVYLMFIPCRLWCRVVSKHIISYHHCCSSIWNSRLFFKDRRNNEVLWSNVYPSCTLHIFTFNPTKTSQDELKLHLPIPSTQKQGTTKKLRKQTNQTARSSDVSLLQPAPGGVVRALSKPFSAWRCHATYRVHVSM